MSRERTPLGGIPEPLEALTQVGSHPHAQVGREILNLQPKGCRVFTLKNLFLLGAIASVGIGVLGVVDFIYLKPAQRFSRILVDNEQYQLSVVQVTKDVPVHVHAEGDHIHYNVAGQAVMDIGGQEIEVGPGSTTVIPANVPHGTKLISKQLSYFHVIVYAPGQMTSMKGE